MMIVRMLLVLSLAATPLAAQEKAAQERAGQEKAAPAKSDAKKTSAGKATADNKDDKEADSSDGAGDRDAIRRASREFVEAFNSGNPKAVAAMWTENGDYVDDSGEVFTGRDAIAKEYTEFFKEHKGFKLTLVIDSLRLLRADAAIEDGRAMLDPQPAGAPAISKYTAVHIKSGGKWRLASVRDTRVEMRSGYQHVADLEFLIGTWTAEESGSKMRSVCRWVANKSFVQRDYTVTRPDKSTDSGVQLIGFNPQTGNVQSWNFSSDGGHAIGVWTPRADGWQAEVVGVTGDGTETSAVNILTRLDDNAYTWQSVERTASGAPVPDVGEVVIKRQSSK